MEFVESFMKFSFADDDLFFIEKDPLIVETDGVKACEYIVLINPNVALIEGIGLGVFRKHFAIFCVMW